MDNVISSSLSLAVAKTCLCYILNAKNIFLSVRKKAARKWVETTFRMKIRAADIETISPPAKFKRNPIPLIYKTAEQLMCTRHYIYPFECESDSRFIFFCSKDERI